MDSGEPKKVPPMRPLWAWVAMHPNSEDEYDIMSFLGKGGQPTPLISRDENLMRQARVLVGKIIADTSMTAHLVTFIPTVQDTVLPDLAWINKRKTYNLQKNSCPYCDALLDKITGYEMPGEEKVSIVGSFTICIKCAQPLRITDDLKLRKLNPGELEAAYQANKEFAEQFEILLQSIRDIDRSSV